MEIMHLSVFTMFLMCSTNPNCFDSYAIDTTKPGLFSLAGSNNENMHVGALDDQMIIWANGDIATRVSSYNESEGRLINDIGQAAGLGRNGIFEDDRLILANIDGTYQTLATITGSEGWSSLTAMNSNGSIVGNYSAGHGSSVWQAFVWVDEAGLQFIEPATTTTYARSIDSDNRVTGQIEIDGVYHAMLWEDGKMIDLHELLDLDGGGSVGMGFDNQGRILISSAVNAGRMYFWYDIFAKNFTDVYTFPLAHLV